MICQYIETKKKEFGAWPICKVLHWRRSQDRPEHLTHAAKTRPPSARSLRDEVLKAEISRVHWYGHHSPSLRHRDAYPR